MDVRKLLVAVAVGGAVVLPSEAHRGPEQHPTVQEFEEVVSELSIASDDMERRLSERLDGVEARVGEPDQQGIADAVEGAVGLAGAELVQSSNELRDWVNTIAVIGAALIVGLGGLSALLGFRVSAVRKLLSESAQQAGESEEARTKPTDEVAREGEKEEERSAERRVVTQTRKGRIRRNIKELHNPDESGRHEKLRVQSPTSAAEAFNTGPEVPEETRPR